MTDFIHVLASPGVPLVIAHRGASQAAPENTVSAAQRAIEMGADAVEVDVRRTSDGVLVAHHDPSCLGNVVRDTSFQALQKGADGQVATLMEIVDATAGQVGLDIHVKEEDFEGEVIDLLDARMRREEFLVTSFSPITVAAAKRRGVQTGLLSEARTNPVKLVRQAHTCGADLIAHAEEILDTALVDLAEAHRMPLLIWTVNDPASMTRHTNHRAVAGIITDVPDLAGTILRRDLASDAA